jgi:hypothetical protein
MADAPHRVNRSFVFVTGGFIYFFSLGIPAVFRRRTTGKIIPPHSTKVLT